MRRTITTVLAAGLAAATTLAAPAGAAPASKATCTSTWVGAANAPWTVPVNWSPRGVPTASSVVCVTTSAGPRVRVGVAAVAAELHADATSLWIDGSLTAGLVDVSASTVRGAGTLAATPGPADNVLESTMLGGALTVTAGNLTLQGSGVHCAGSSVAVCLGGTSRIAAALVHAMGDVAGTTSAHPALSATVAVGAVAAVGATVRLAVQIDTPELSVDGPGFDPAGTMSFDDWNGLTSGGTLVKHLIVGDHGAGTVVAPARINEIGAGGILFGTNVVTPLGRDAVRAISQIDAGGRLTPFETRTLVPAGGTLVNDGGFDSYTGTVTINGSVSNSGNFSAGDVTVTQGLDNLAAGYVQTTGTLTVGAFTNAGIVNTDGHIVAPTYSQTAGSTVLTRYAASPSGPTVLESPDIVIAGGTLSFLGVNQIDTGGAPIDVRRGVVVRLASDVCGSASDTGFAMVPGAILTATLSTCDPRLTTTGAITLPNTLQLSTIPQGVPLGTHTTILRSTAGITGTFTTIKGANSGPNHWQISYTATTVTATLVSGNV